MGRFHLIKDPVEVGSLLVFKELERPLLCVLRRFERVYRRSGPYNARARCMAAEPIRYLKSRSMFITSSLLEISRYVCDDPIESLIVSQGFPEAVAIKYARVRRLQFRDGVGPCLGGCLVVFGP